MSDPFRSMTATLFSWPQVDGVLREIGEFKPCSMCEREVQLGTSGAAEYSNVHYGKEPTCLAHAKLLLGLHAKAVRSRTVRQRRKKTRRPRPSDVLDHDFVWEEDE